MARRTLYDFSADTGIVIPDTDDVREGIVTDFKGDGTANNPGIFGPNCDTSEETHIGRFIDEITELVVQTTGINAQNANQFNLNFATGTFLDNHGAAIGVPRQSRSQTLVTVTLSASSKGTVRAGTVFESDDEYEFSLVSDVVFDDPNAVTVEGETSYVATGTAAAVEYGRIYCPAGSLKTVKTLVALDVSDLTVTNAAAEYELGREEETDAHYRARIKAAMDKGGASPSAILNALYGIVGADGKPVVSDAVVLENGHAYPVVKRGIAVSGHSIFVCASGGDDAAIADAIYRAKTSGAGYTTTGISALVANRVQVEVGNTTVTFFRPVQRGLTVNVTADVSQYAGQDAKNAVMEAVKDYLVLAGIGAEITEETMVAAIYERVGSAIRVKELALNYGGSTTAVLGVKLSAGEVFTTDTAPGSGPRLVVNTTLVG